MGIRESEGSRTTAVFSCPSALVSFAMLLQAALSWGLPAQNSAITAPGLLLAQVRIQGSDSLPPWLLLANSNHSPAAPAMRQ